MLQENEGCLFHLPLSFNGDLSDRVTGNVIELSGNGSMVWDATEGMYLITHPATVGQYVGRIWIGHYPYKFPLDSHTSIGQAKKKSTSGSVSTPYCSTSVGSATQIFYNASQNIANYPASIVKSAVVINHQDQKRWFYQQGAFYREYAEAATWLPSAWNIDGYIYFGYIASSAFYNTQYYIKDLYLFNRVLTAEEIYKIQGY